MTKNRQPASSIKTGTKLAMLNNFGWSKGRPTVKSEAVLENGEGMMWRSIAAETGLRMTGLDTGQLF